jgi:acyl carrier protein
MEMNEILQQVNSIFCDVLDNSELKIDENTTANDVEDWDSLTHIQLVVAIEKHFKMKFTAAEIRQWKNVGEMCTNIKSRIK